MNLSYTADAAATHVSLVSPDGVPLAILITLYSLGSAALPCLGHTLVMVSFEVSVILLL